MSKSFLQRLLPQSNDISLSEKLVSGLLAFLSLLIVTVSMYYLVGENAYPYMALSVGASAVLLFAVPSSPLSQPWSVIGGHLISALIGVCCQLLIPYEPLAVSTAVSLAIIAMLFLRCLHPPGGAAALGAILGGPEIHALEFWYVLMPIGINATLIVICAILINRILPKSRYPAITTFEKKSLSAVAAEWALGPPRFNEADLHAALENMDSYVDISEPDLARIYALAVMNSNKRRIGDVRCTDIMTMNPLRLRFDDELEQGWKVLRDNKLKAAPIVDAFDRPIGIVTINDFISITENLAGSNLQQRLQTLLERTPGMESKKIETVGEIMSSPVTSATDSQHIMELVSIFTERRFHHMPIVDEDNRLVGMITRSDLMKALLVTRT